MSLNIPNEPQEVKGWIAKIEGLSGSSKNINWDSLNVWYGNKLPKYLWDEWKNELKPRGFTWQKFLRILSMRTDAVLLWYKGINTWEQFMKDMIALIDGPLGQNISQK